jgi:membrane protease YdiL (CAAX protease family)
MKSVGTIALLFFYCTAALAADPFDFQLSNPERARATFWPEVASYFLPGFDQWWEGQNSAGLLYTGLAVGGSFVISSSGVHSYSDNQSAGAQIQQGNDAVRTYLLGGEIYSLAGSLSVYHSFRSAVRTHQEHGGYTFLPKEKEETPDQLMLAPFHFSYLERPTTYIPLGLLLISVLASPMSGHQMLLSDAFYSVANSYGAGVGEESLFRGYIAPRLMESFDSPFWSNTAASTLFGAAHIASDNQAPIAQFLFGWYVGWVSQRNQWTISEGIFIHAWWDTISFLYDLSDRSAMKKPLNLPLVNATF